MEKKKKALTRANAFSEDKKVSGLAVVDHEELLKGETVQEIRIEDINPPKYHDRKSYSKKSIQEMARNIQASDNKILQPIVVRKKNGGYERIIGFRRMEAAKLLNWTKVPAIVLEEMSDEKAMLFMLSENMQREDLNLYDETVSIMEYLALSFNTTFEEIKDMLWHFRNMDSGRIKDTCNDTKKSREAAELITKRLGNITVSSLINRLKVFSFNQIILSALKEGRVSYTVAVELHKLKSNEDIIHFIKEIEEGRASLKDLKNFIKTKRIPTPPVSFTYNIKKSEKGTIIELVGEVDKKVLDKIEKLLK